MQITFLFGNGFDVNLGLKTRYEDFYPTYFESCKTLPENNCIRNFSEKIKKDYKKWSDFEWAFSQVAKGTYKEIGEIMADFNDKFADFLRMQCESCNVIETENNMNEIAKYIFKPYGYLERSDEQKLHEFYINHLAETHTYNFISLNYTDTLERLLENNKQLPPYHISGGANRYGNIYNKILHLHGSIGEGYIITGIDTLEQFKSEAMKRNTRLGRHCVKKTINEQYGYADKEIRYEQMIYASNVICAFGVAFGETDRSRWTVISEWLRKSKNNKLIVFMYNPQFSEFNRMSKGLLLDAIDAARDEYLKLLGFEDEFEKMYDQIFVADSAKALRFTSAESEEEDVSA